MIMRVSITDSSAINDHTIVEQGAFSFRDRLELLKKISELRGVKIIYFGNFLFLGFVVAVMRKLVVAFGYADHGIGPIIAIVRNDVCVDPGGVGLKGQRREVEHEIAVLL